MRTIFFLKLNSSKILKCLESQQEVGGDVSICVLNSSRKLEVVCCKSFDGGNINFPICHVSSVASYDQRIKWL